MPDFFIPPDSYLPDMSYVSFCFSFKLDENRYMIYLKNSYLEV